MSKSSKVLVIAFAILILAGQAMMTVAQNQRSRESRTAVANIKEIFDRLVEKADIEADLQSQADKLSQEEKQKLADLRALENLVTKELVPGTKAHTEKQAELTEATINLRAWAEYSRIKLEREKALAMERVYKKMLTAIGKVATQNGYDVVLFQEEPPDFTKAKPEAIPTLIQVRKVLWADESLDLTEQIINRMNTEYKNPQAAARGG